jgi:uncharacterized MAPEG superfamily protein
LQRHEGFDDERRRPGAALASQDAKRAIGVHRVAHAAVYWLAIPFVRTLVFTLGFVALVGIFWEVIK